MPREETGVVWEVHCAVAAAAVSQRAVAHEHAGRDAQPRHRTAQKPVACRTHARALCAVLVVVLNAFVNHCACIDERVNKVKRV